MKNTEAELLAERAAAGRTHGTKRSVGEVAGYAVFGPSSLSSSTALEIWT